MHVLEEIGYNIIIQISDVKGAKANLRNIVEVDLQKDYQGFHKNCQNATTVCHAIPSRFSSFFNFRFVSLILILYKAMFLKHVPFFILWLCSIDLFDYIIYC